MKKGFTLLEILVVIGIIAILTGTSLAAYTHLLRVGERTRAHELVCQTATALTALFDKDGVWPVKIRNAKNATTGGGQLLDVDAAYALSDQFSLAVNTTSEKTVGNDRFGIVTPWAAAVIKRLGTEATEETHVNSTSEIKDHILHFAVDLDGDGLIEDVMVGGQGTGSKTTTISVRATAIVWCCDQEGNIVDYATGAKKGGIYSWTYGQTQAVK